MVSQRSRATQACCAPPSHPIERCAQPKQETRCRRKKSLALRARRRCCSARRGVATPSCSTAAGTDSWGDGDGALQRRAGRNARRLSLRLGLLGVRGDDGRWRWGDPLAQWEAFIAARPAELGDARGRRRLPDRAQLRPQALDRGLPRRLPWPRLPVLYCARYDWSLSRRLPHRPPPTSPRARRPLADRLRWYAQRDRTIATRRRRRRADRPLRRCPQPTMSQRRLRRHDRARARVHRRRRRLRVNLAQPLHRRRARADAGRRCSRRGRSATRCRSPPTSTAATGRWCRTRRSASCACDGDRVATFPIKGTRRRDPRHRRGGARRRVARRRQGARRARDGRRPRAQRPRPRVRDRQRRGGRLFAAVRAVSAAGAHGVRGARPPAPGHRRSPRCCAPSSPAARSPARRRSAPCRSSKSSSRRARGFYTGAIGWTELDGRSRFNIAIRTAVLDAGGLTYWAGGGIVADSDAEREYAETLLKSEALFRALGGTGKEGGMKANGYVFLNGRIVDAARATVSVYDRGLLYGDGLFETMRALQGRRLRDRGALPPPAHVGRHPRPADPQPRLAGDHRRAAGQERLGAAGRVGAADDHARTGRAARAAARPRQTDDDDHGAAARPRHRRASEARREGGAAAVLAPRLHPRAQVAQLPARRGRQGAGVVSRRLRGHLRARRSRPHRRHDDVGVRRARRRPVDRARRRHPARRHAPPGHRSRRAPTAFASSSATSPPPTCASPTRRSSPRR